MKIWEEDVNAKGGLLGRPVKLVYYDDQSSPATVPGIYTKLLDVDKVNFAVSPYASTQIAPAMPIMMQKEASLYQPVRHRHQRRVQLRQVFLDAADGADAQAVVHDRLLQGGDGAGPETADHRDGSPPTPSSAAMPAKARARTPRPPA